MIVPDVVRVVSQIARVFDRLGVAYRVGGSLASSAFGVARSTLDVDLVADLHPEHVESLVALVGRDYYVDAEAVRQAVRDHSAFNMIHLESMLKIDVFVLKPLPFDRQAFARPRRQPLATSDTEQADFLSPEDVVLYKLAWYQSGGRVSERQWQDVLGVLKVQGAALDQPYLRQWARELGVSDLLKTALKEAGLAVGGET